MKTYDNLIEAKADLKAKTGKAIVRYFVNGREVPAGTWRTSEGEKLIYRSGLEIYAEKNSKVGHLPNGGDHARCPECNKLLHIDYDLIDEKQ